MQICQSRHCRQHGCAHRSTKPIQIHRLKRWVQQQQVPPQSKRISGVQLLKYQPHQLRRQAVKGTQYVQILVRFNLAKENEGLVSSSQYRKLTRVGVQSPRVHFFIFFLKKIIDSEKEKKRARKCSVGDPAVRFLAAHVPATHLRRI